MRTVQQFLRDVEADRSPGTERRHLDHFRTRATAKIKYDLILDLSFDLGQRHAQLAFSRVHPALHRGPNTRRHQAQEAILNLTQHDCGIAPGVAAGSRLPRPGISQSLPRAICEPFRSSEADNDQSLISPARIARSRSNCSPRPAPAVLGWGENRPRRRWESKSRSPFLPGPLQSAPVIESVRPRILHP